MSPYDIDLAGEAAQWALDHPNGISDEELESMVRYSVESCREEGCYATRTPAPCPDCRQLRMWMRTDDVRCPACAEEDEG